MLKESKISKILKRLGQKPFSVKQVALEFDCSITSIYSIMKKYNIQNNEKRMYWCDDNIFEHIDNEEKAYWLGFLMGDGSICKNRICLCLNEKDLDHIIKFKSFLKYNGQISKKQKDNCYKLAVTSKKICQDLIKYGLIPNKTYHNIKTPNIPKELLIHFYRGLFDADGSFSINTSRKNRRPNPCINFTSYYPDIIIELKDFILGDATKSKVSFCQKQNSSAYMWTTSGYNLFKLFGEKIYTNSSIYLERKHELYKKYLELGLTIL